jgi:hypothetical protein
MIFEKIAVSDQQSVISIQLNSEAKEALEIASTARSPLGRIALGLLFATKRDSPGGVCG